MSFKNLSEVQTIICIDPYCSGRPAAQFEIHIFNAELVTEVFGPSFFFFIKNLNSHIRS